MSNVRMLSGAVKIYLCTIFLLVLYRHGTARHGSTATRQSRKDTCTREVINVGRRINKLTYVFPCNMAAADDPDGVKLFGTGGMYSNVFSGFLFDSSHWPNWEICNIFGGVPVCDGDGRPIHTNYKRRFWSLFIVSYTMLLQIHHSCMRAMRNWSILYNLVCLVCVVMCCAATGNDQSFRTNGVFK